MPDTATRKAEDDRARRARFPIIIACGLIMILILGVGYAIGQYVPRQARATAAATSRAIANEQQDRKTILAGCIRGNQLKAAINKSNGATYEAELALYRAFSAVIALDRGLSRGAGTKTPNTKVLRRHRRIEFKVARDIVNAAGTAKNAAEQVQYQPYTDCQIAANHPDTYRLKPSIPWSEHLHRIVGALPPPNG